MATYGFHLTKTKEEDIATFDTFFDNFRRGILSMGLTIDQKNKFFEFNKMMLNEVQKMCVQRIEKNPNNSLKTIEELYQYAIKKISESDSQYKREQRLKRTTTYVEPIEKAIGMRWESITDKKTQKIMRRCVQSTMQYVPIVQTIKSIFQCPKLRKLFSEHNDNHICTPGIFEFFCCGDRYKELTIAKDSPPIQIQLFTDEFEPCDALKSKAGLHKTMAFYFQIKNLPAHLSSKLNNIFLVALCNSDDIKGEYTGINSVLEMIMSDVREFESIGVDVGDGIILRAIIAYVSFDNLGGNVCFGLSRSFSANHYCRFCLSHKKDCKHMTSENLSTIRTRGNYEAILARMAEMEISDLTETKGIEKKCALNGSKYFHIFENLSVDVMHDILEGVGQFLLHKVFTFCFNNDVITAARLQNIVQYFNYGELNKRNIPSILNFNKKNLGQNATQTRCLLLNIPFILYQFKSKLLPIWDSVETLLQIMHIVFSSKLTEDDIDRLTGLIEYHLKIIIEKFDEELRPKYHLLLHYPRTIRKMGPVSLMSTMRHESKHQFFY